MKCDRCQAQIEPGEERRHLGQNLCEDCYMDVLSPVRTCDPWAVYTAKSLGEGDQALTPRQARMLRLLEDSGGLEPEELRRRLDPELDMGELQRDFAALRHMEKARAERRGDRLLWRVW